LGLIAGPEAGAPVENFTISLPFLYRNSISHGQVNGRVQIAPGWRSALVRPWSSKWPGANCTRLAQCIGKALLQNGSSPQNNFSGAETVQKRCSFLRSATVESQRPNVDIDRQGVHGC